MQPLGGLPIYASAGEKRQRPVSQCPAHSSKLARQDNETCSSSISTDIIIRPTRAAASEFVASFVSSETMCELGPLGNALVTNVMLGTTKEDFISLVKQMVQHMITQTTLKTQMELERVKGAPMIEEAHAKIEEAHAKIEQARVQKKWKEQQETNRTRELEIQARSTKEEDYRKKLKAVSEKQKTEQDLKISIMRAKKERATLMHIESKGSQSNY